jgi:hypothetical protein
MSAILSPPGKPIVSYLRRISMLVAIPALMTGVAFGGWLYASSTKPGISSENRDLIRKGMSIAEVEAVFGCPGRLAAKWNGLEGTKLLVWEQDDFFADVIFDSNGRVLEVPSEWGDLANESVLMRLRRHWLDF